MRESKSLFPKVDDLITSPGLKFLLLSSYSNSEITPVILTLISSSPSIANEYEVSFTSSLGFIV